MLPKSILLVDDSNDLITVMTHILAEKGFHVAVAMNGKEAVDYPALDSIDLIIMDIDMPVMSGIEATSHLRADGFTGPIIAYSGGVDFQKRSDFINAGFSAHTDKPVDFDELESLIRSLLPQNSLR